MIRDPETQVRRYLEQNVAAAANALTDVERAALDALPEPVGGRY